MKFLLAITLVFTSFTCVTAYSKCEEPVRLIEQNKKAPCTGFLFSPEAEAQVAKDYEDLQFFKSLSERLEKRKELTDKEINILDKRLQLYIEQSNTLSNQLSKRESESKWEKVLWFSLGVIVTGLAVNGASKLNR